MAETWRKHAWRRGETNLNPEDLTTADTEGEWGAVKQAIHFFQT
jgi:hypothetical protein